MKSLSLSTVRAARPNLLFVSHCVPTWRPTRSADRRRAWQLLMGVAQTHEVYLACVADGPVSLEHWRDLSKRVKQVVITPVGLMKSVAAKVMSIVSPSWRNRIVSRSLAQPVAEWSDTIEFSTVLHASAGLLVTTKELTGVQRVVDVPSLAAVGRGALNGCDRVIVRTEEEAQSARTIGLRALVLPEIQAGLTLTGMEEQPASVVPVPLRKAA